MISGRFAEMASDQKLEPASFAKPLISEDELETVLDDWAPPWIVMAFFCTTRAVDTCARRYKLLSIFCVRRRRLRAAYAELKTMISVAQVTSLQPGSGIARR